MKIIDTYSAILTAYENEEFSFDRWKQYIDRVLPELYWKLAHDTHEALTVGNVSDSDFLSVLNNVACNREMLETAHKSFLQATTHLEKVIQNHFGKELDVTIVFYLGLCNGAGWVTEYRGETTILLGVEKIIELNWCHIHDMYGLIYHELGHCYHKQFGTWEQSFNNNSDAFLWQLFSEGVAMCFEQTLICDPEFYHQDKDGWKTWCESHFDEIKADFTEDMKTISFCNQRYFGDWRFYHGYSDVGYFLGCRFVRFLLASYTFDEVICLDISTLKELYQRFER